MGRKKKKKRKKIKVRPEKKCFQCKENFKRDYLCKKHNFCPPCRKISDSCNCCGHIRAGECCDHGICFKKCIDKNYVFNTTKCACFNHYDSRTRDYDEQILQKENNPSPTNENIFPSSMFSKNENLNLQTTMNLSSPPDEIQNLESPSSCFSFSDCCTKKNFSFSPPSSCVEPMHFPDACQNLQSTMNLPSLPDEKQNLEPSPCCFSSCNCCTEQNFSFSPPPSFSSFDEMHSDAEFIPQTFEFSTSFDQDEYEIFPIKFFREDFPTFNLHNFLGLQCILYWDDCKLRDLFINPSYTHHFFIPTKYQKILTLPKVIHLFNLYEQGKINATDFLKFSKISQDEIDQNFDEFVKQITSFHTLYPNITFTNLLEQLVHRVFKVDPTFVSESYWHPSLLDFSIQSIRSSLDVLQIIERDENMTAREKIIFKHQILFTFLYNNTSFINSDLLQNFFSVSKHLLDRTLNHIEKFKSGETNDINLEYSDTREVYSDNAYDLIADYYEKYGVLFEGKKIVKGPTKINGKREEHHKCFLPGTQDEFYQYFRVHPDYGPKCTKSDGTFEIPSKSFFLKQKPYWIKNHPKVRSGFCKYCYQVRENLPTFISILKRNCCCGNVKKCPNFLDEFSELYTDKNQKCNCASCLKCKVCNLTDSNVSNFMKILNCKEHEIHGIQYPKQDCYLHPQECSCSFCKLPDVDSLLEKFCSSSKDKIKYQDETKVEWKFFGKEKIKTSNTKHYMNETILTDTVDVFTFLEKFHSFLTKDNNGFIFHYYTYTMQNENYKEMIKGIKNGDYGDTVAMMVLDHANNYTVRDSKKLTSQQHFSDKKCKILGITQFYRFEDEFTGCSNFIFADQDIRKNNANALSEVDFFIEKMKTKNENLQTVHIWSDAASGEFFDRFVFGNFSKISKKHNVRIIWHYFASCHGKAICDSEFSRLKTKLDDQYIESAFARNAQGIWNFCDKKLKNWKCEGTIITERKYFLRENNAKKLKDYEGMTNARRYRCLMWDPMGFFFRKTVSCHCLHCVLIPNVETDCKIISTTGIFEKYDMKKIIKKLKSKKNVKPISLFEEI